jgi:ubiquinone/menaquinone biosynthesis C-methylase UbiE
MRTEMAAGLHVPAGGAADSSAYDQWVGRWSRLFVPAVLAAGDLRPGLRVLDVSTGTGEASLAIISRIGLSGLLVGADIAPAMLHAARVRLTTSAFLPVAADGQALPFANASFDAVICQLGLQFFPDPASGLMEFRRVLPIGH